MINKITILKIKNFKTKKINKIKINLINKIIK